ncbi:MAG: fumarylacetoacetate hydrolase family protein [Burkholderiaceae bacterium]
MRFLLRSYRKLNRSRQERLSPGHQYLGPVCNILYDGAMTQASLLAQVLHAAHQRGDNYQALQTAGLSLTTAQAYGVQDELITLRCNAQASRVMGYKIGLTSATMQAMCGIDSPVHGRILDSGLISQGASLDLARYGRLGIECEIAVRVGRDVPAPTNTLEALASYVDAICPALELIDDRHADYQCLDGPSLIADNAWNAGIVLGRWQPLPADLRERRGRLYSQGLQVDEARVGDALDHPLSSVLWLVADLARQGRTLQSGQVIMTGSIVKTQFPARGENWRYEVEGLGGVALNFVS